MNPKRSRVSLKVAQPVKWSQLPPLIQHASNFPHWSGLFALSSLRIYITRSAHLPKTWRWMQQLDYEIVNISRFDLRQLREVILGRFTSIFRRQWAMCVARLPADLEYFLDGQDRRNLRTGARGAQRAGFTTAWLEGGDLFSAATRIMERRGWQEPLTTEKFSEMCGGDFRLACGVVTMDKSGDPDTLNVGLQFGTTFFLRVGYSSTGGHVRWLSLSELYRHCHQRGIRLIIGDQIFGVRSGTMEFLRGAGFEIINIRYHVVESPPPTP